MIVVIECVIASMLWLATMDMFGIGKKKN